MRRPHRQMCFLYLALVLVASPTPSITAAAQQSQSQPSKRGLLVPAEARIGARPAQIARALTWQSGTEAWKPEVHKERGLALELYARVAPATVVVRTSNGHGSGIIEDASGWILTNAHCVEAASTDLASGAQVAQINFGRMRGDFMELDATAIPALVYKKDEARDLALLKLSRLPEGMKALPKLNLAKTPPRPGSDCIAVGHPVAGMLWTVRSCEVTNIGVWPEEQIDFVITRLQATTGEDQERLRQLASSMPRRKIVLSSCRINPGDSGGPLVDTKGDLVGVTFAIPLSDPMSGVSLDKFSYHVHGDEVRQFLAERPDVPPLHVPDPWPPAAFNLALDLDEDGKPETLIFGIAPNQPPTGLMVDVDQNFLPDLTPEKFAAAGADFRWDFEYVYHPIPEKRAFYDSDDDGQFDLVLVDVDANGVADISLTQSGGTWVRSDPGQRQFQDAAAVPSAMQPRLTRIIAAIQEHEAEE